MLAVVEQEQELLGAQVLEHARLERPSRAGVHAEGRRDDLDDLVVVVGDSELAEPCAVGVVVDGVRGGLEREPGLAHASRAGDGHERCPTERIGGVGDGLVAPDERAHLRREIARNRIEGRERREVVRETGAGQLEDAFRPGEIAEAVLAEIDEAEVVVEHVARELFGRERHEDLAAVRRVHQAGGAIDRRAVVVAVAELGVARVDTDPHPERTGHAPRFGDDRPFGVGGGGECIVGTGEDRVDAVAGRLHDLPVARPTASRRMASWRASASRMASGMSSQRRVELTRSVKRNVTVPDAASCTPEG